MRFFEDPFLFLKSWNASEWAVVVACLSAAISLTAAVFSLLNTGRLIRAQIVSANRQKWIDAIRDDLALFLRNFGVVDRHMGRSIGSSNVITEDIDLAIKEMLLLSLRIRLKLNPMETEHRQLLSMIDDLRLKHRPETDGLPDKLVEIAQQIFKSEWKRIKRGR